MLRIQNVKFYIYMSRSPLEHETVEQLNYAKLEIVKTRKIPPSPLLSQHPVSAT